MLDKEKAVLTAGTAKDGKGTTYDAINSHFDSTTELKRPQGYIESFLKHGAANAINTKTLMELTRLDLRQLRKQVEAERRSGVLILTKPQGGYFLPSSGENGKAEIQAFYQIQRAKALSLLKTIKAARKALQELDGQETFEV